MSQPHHTSGDPALPWLLVAVVASALACSAVVCLAAVVRLMGGV